MIKKKFIKSRNCYQITFEIPKQELPENLVVETVALVGDFNSWNPTINLMESGKKGDYKAMLDLEPIDKNLQYRYLANGTYWFNAWNPDGYVANESGSDNCVLRLTAVWAKQDGWKNCLASDRLFHGVNFVDKQAWSCNYIE